MTIENKISSRTKTKKIAPSIGPPTFMLPRETLLKGQNGLIPSLVQESANKCKPYPKKKGRARTGRYNDKTIVTKIVKVKLWKSPRCFVNICNGRKSGFFPTDEKPESISGNIVEIKTTGINIHL